MKRRGVGVAGGGGQGAVARRRETARSAQQARSGGEAARRRSSRRRRQGAGGLCWGQTPLTGGTLIVTVMVVGKLLRLLLLHPVLLQLVVASGECCQEA